ncbi:MAG: TIGR02646 family protein, partial [Boseongicola sp. SB0677_bin_26]|nr:TIGR02646 family protein [Boseongicola sp. SB0677_bin_26]
MRGSHEKARSPVLADWLALESTDWQPSYPFPNDIRQSVVDALREAQRGLCVYCGRRLDSDLRGRFHIEHFRPQSSYPNLSLELANLFLSCGPEGTAGKAAETCGNAKGDRFEEDKSVEPDYPACTRRFRFLLSGEVAPRSDDDTAAVAMIELLNLNHRELRKDREDILDRIDGESLDLSD